MKKFSVIILAVALISMFSLVAFGQPKKGNRPNQPTTTTQQPRVKKPVNNSTDSVADYNRQNNQQNRQSNQQEKQAQRQAQQQERQAQREAKQQERQNNQANRQVNRGQNSDGESNTRGMRKAENNNTQSPNSANAPTRPCSQLSGGDWLYKGRKCTLENGQVTTVGAYQRSQGNVDGTAKTPNAGGNRRANRQNSANTTETNSSETNTNPRRRQNRNNSNNPPSNIPGADVNPTNPNLPNVPGATVKQTNPNLPNISGATVTPNPSNNNNPNVSPNQPPTDQIQANPPNGNNQANPFGFPYPQRPDDIVTWNPDGGEYGFTTADQGWEFIMTNAGVAVRRAGREGSVVAHTKCNDTENYDFQQTGNGTRISRIMCIPKRAGLPKLRPSIMIVPQSEYFNNRR